jgi:lysyl-tRNA synthetase class 1
MQWLNSIVDELISRHPDGDIIVSSGVSPSGTYHLGTLREVLTAEVMLRELKRRGRDARHYHVVDDLDIFRKVPVDVSPSFEQYLGKPLCDVPSPDGSDRSYADYFLADLLAASQGLHLEAEIIRAHEKYRSGYFVPAIEAALDNVPIIRTALEQISGRNLEEQWSPVQVIEDGYLKNRRFISIQKDAQEIVYEDKNGEPRNVSYAHGEVKLNWRIDWPARWSLLGVQAEPFGRDHATKGGSYDTGVEIVKQVYKAEAPYPVPYNFINKTGDTKKMSKSAGDTVTAADLLKLLPAEVLWYFIIRYSPDKLLFFDQGPTLIRLFDEFSELLAKPEKTADEQQLLDLCLQGVDEPTVSRIPFTHLVASYQAALKDADKTIDVIARTEHADIARSEAHIIRNELRFIDEWLEQHAPEDVKFSLTKTVDASGFSDSEKAFFTGLAAKVSEAPTDADGGYFHEAIYGFKTEEMGPKDLFQALYKLTIGKTSGPRAGWFLSILPREWLIARLRLDDSDAVH